jgi:hypothetical protein
VALWCDEFIDYNAMAMSLRPPRLERSTLQRNRWDAIDEIADMRELDLPTETEARPALHGRLLVYFPDGTLSDGAAAAKTSGLFDVNNAPPCGTWLGYFDDRTRDPNRSVYIVAWMPMRLVPIASRGIDANPEGCLCWLPDAHVRFREVAHAVAVVGAG